MRKPLTPKAKRRLLGLGQDLLILVLVVSAVMLAGGSGLLDFAGDISGGVLGMQSGQNQGGQKEYTAAAEPLSMMPTPGGPTKQRMGAFIFPVSLRTARYSTIRSLIFSKPKWSSSSTALHSFSDSRSCVSSVQGNAIT